MRPNLVTTLVLALGLLAMPAFAAPAPTVSKDALLRVLIDSPTTNVAQARRLSTWLMKQDFDIAGVNRQTGKIEVITNQSGLAKLTAHGLKTQIKETRRPGITPLMGLDQRYLNPERLVARLQSISKTYPTLTRLVQIGTSLQGRPVLALLISTTPDGNDPRGYEKPSLVVDGMHHAREIMTTEIVVDMAEQLLGAAMAEEGLARKTLETWNIWLVPMLNIDGNNIVWTSNNWWRKNAHESNGSLHGVDINRNYPFGWNSCGGSSGSKGAENYRGASAGSEPETRALVGLADAIVPAASLSYHSYSELVLYPMGCDGALTAEDALVSRIGHELANRLPSDSGSGNYTPGAPWQTLYSVDGDSMDYFYGAHGTLAYTFEVNQEFQPSYDVREPTLQKHRVAWGYFIDQIGQNLLALKVIDLKTGQALPAQIEINTITHSKGEAPLHTNSAGNFFKVLDPGRYAARARLADGRVGSVEFDMTGQPNHVTLTIGN